MASQQNNLTLITDAQSAPRGNDRERADRRSTAILVAIILSFSAASAWVAAAMSPKQAAVVVSKSASPPPTQPFEYFPSQYVNQATEPEAHIQAF
jgi:hypothetical protein